MQKERITIWFLEGRTWEPDRGAEEEATSVEKCGGSSNKEQRQHTSQKTARAKSGLGSGDAADTVLGSCPQHTSAKPSLAGCNYVRVTPIWCFSSTRREDKITVLCKICRIEMICGHSNALIATRGLRGLLHHVRWHHQIFLENTTCQHSQSVCPSSPGLLSGSQTTSQSYT